MLSALICGALLAWLLSTKITETSAQLDLTLLLYSHYSVTCYYHLPILVITIFLLYLGKQLLSYLLLLIENCIGNMRDMSFEWPSAGFIIFCIWNFWPREKDCDDFHKVIYSKDANPNIFKICMLKKNEQHIQKNNHCCGHYLSSLVWEEKSWVMIWLINELTL